MLIYVRVFVCVCHLTYIHIQKCIYGYLNAFIVKRYAHMYEWILIKAYEIAHYIHIVYIHTHSLTHTHVLTQTTHKHTHTHTHICIHIYYTYAHVLSVIRLNVLKLSVVAPFLNLKSGAKLHYGWAKHFLPHTHTHTKYKE